MSLLSVILATAWLGTGGPAAAAEPGDPGPDEGALEVSPPPPDRSALPPVPPPAPRPLPEIAVIALDSGVEAWVLPVEGLRRVRVAVRYLDGTGLLCPERPARCAALGDQLADGVIGASADELAAELDALDADIASWVDVDSSGARLDVPLQHLDEGLERLRDVLLRPELARRELRRWRWDQRLHMQVELPADAWALTATAGHYQWFPEAHPWGMRPGARSWASVRPRHLRAAQARRLGQSPMVILVAGDVDPEALRPHLALLASELGVAGRPGPPPAAPAPLGAALLGIALPGRAQATLRLSLPAPDADAADRAAAELLARVVVDGFQSRINQQLREERGWTYGSAGGWDGRPGGPRLWLQVEVPVEQAAAAMADIEAVLRAAASSAPPTPAEVETAKASALSDHNRRLSDPAGALGLSLAAYRVGGGAALMARSHALAAAEPAEVAALAARMLGPDAPRRWVVTGDRAALEPQLRALRLPLAWRSPEEVAQGEVPVELGDYPAP
jgi:predicted Zn-dependent peptidase